MKISVWEDGKLRDATMEEFAAGHRKKLWFDVTDPSVEDLERVAGGSEGAQERSPREAQ